MILGGKRFGFSLDEMGELIGAEEMPVDEVEQIDRGRHFADKRVDEIRARRSVLDPLKAVLRHKF
jgi:hypothetical protein